MVKKIAYIVIGLGYGDEGKGLTTDYLCLNNSKPLVIRFNGGQQAGHCVVTKDGKKHIFSNFGSGAFRKVPTYWSSYCTVAPVFLMEEFDILDIKCKIYIDKNCPITTHYDILYNRSKEITLGKNRNGSCGVGFGATIDREKQGVSLLFRDLFDTEKNLRTKLLEIKQFYRFKVNANTAFDFDNFDHFREDTNFYSSIKKIKNLTEKDLVVPVTQSQIFNKNWSTYIFEGAQGILLDQNYGNKPHITKSNTTTKNALKILKAQQIDIPIEVFYVTRAYQTRHGNGPFREKHPEFQLINNQDETNVLNEFQGEFRSNFLDVDAIQYALKCDRTFSQSYPKNLMITCLDQIDGEELNFFEDGNLKSIHFSSIHKKFRTKFKNIKYSFSPCAEYIE